MTQNCANPDLRIRRVPRPDEVDDVQHRPARRQRALHRAVRGERQEHQQWIAGGNSVWFQNKGFAIREPRRWTKVYTCDAGRASHGVACSGTTAFAAWCGGRLQQRGLQRAACRSATHDGCDWTHLTSGSSGTSQPVRRRRCDRRRRRRTTCHQRLLAALDRRPGRRRSATSSSRTDGEQLDGHLGANFPDVPANSIKALPNGGLVVGTDLGVVYRAAGRDAVAAARRRTPDDGRDRRRARPRRQPVRRPRTAAASGGSRRPRTVRAQ